MSRSGPQKQPSTIKSIEFIAQTHGYTVSLRKNDHKASSGGKKFLPDVVATPHKGKGKRVFEVEATVTNNTIYKSLLSLLTSLKTGTTATYIVVPTKRVAFTEGCLANLISVIHHFSKSASGRFPKIKLEVLSFADIAKHHKKAKTYRDRDRIGQPPKCPYLPR